MKVLVTGADGFIGGYLVAALREAGHEVVGAVRRPARFRRCWPGSTAVACDMARDIRPEDWAGRLDGVEAVINAAGVLQAPSDRARRIHADAPIALFTAAGAAGVGRVVQLSAMGADLTGPTDYQRTKAAADAFLETSGLPWSVLRPSVILAPGAYGGTALFRAMAAMPVAIPLVGDGGHRFQPIHVEDLCRTILSLLGDGDPPLRRVLHPVSDPPIAMRDMLAGYRAWMGLGKARFLPVPRGLCRAAARVGDWTGGPVTTTSYSLMTQGVTADPAAFRDAMGFAPDSFAEALARQPAQVADLWQARLYLLRPLLIAALAILWLGTALATALSGVSGTIAAITAPLGPGLAAAVTYGGAAVDLAVGIGLLVGRWRRPAALGGMAVTAGYLVALTALAPSMWLDPLGSLTKALVVLAALGVVAVIGRDRG